MASASLPGKKNNNLNWPQNFNRWMAKSPNYRLRSNAKKCRLEILDRILDELAGGSRPPQSLPADLSRDDIYEDHD